jgi:hypothetical protein
MNWKRGLMRLWLVLVCVWLVFVVWLTLDVFVMHPQTIESCAEARTLDPSLGSPWRCIEYGRPLFERLANYAALAVLPPIGVLIAGIVGSWIVLGFSKGTK